MNERRDLTPEDFAAAVAACAALCRAEADLSAWGQAHASTLSAIAESHPLHFQAARRAYAERLRTLKGDQRD